MGQVQYGWLTLSALTIFCWLASGVARVAEKVNIVRRNETIDGA